MSVEESQENQSPINQGSTPDIAMPADGGSAPAATPMPSFFLTPRWSIQIFLTEEQYARIVAAVPDWEEAVLQRKVTRFMRRFMKTWWETYGLQGLEGFFEDEQEQMFVYTEKCIFRMLITCLATLWEVRVPEGEAGSVVNLLDRLDALVDKLDRDYPSDADLGY
ncbi:hypothetical protein ARMSODRAFT_978394 [Armillaria solidipes]|uniref:Uncharacterized protein n=1 Tax=Armillaria solidipes TaxID=1076256 RepID=A0A2H3BGW2_9AGAR|nr:hypothetical protein ARMSODRAFT_978394 [Armillaria solidipes]